MTPEALRDRGRDGLVAARHGAANAVLAYREARRARSESDAFRQAWSLAEPIIGQVVRAEANLLHDLAAAVPSGSDIVEIGSFLGRSTVILGHAAAQVGATVHAVDPHTGDRVLVEAVGLDSMDTFPQWQRNVEGAGMLGVVVPVVAPSVDASASWSRGQTVSLLFVDGWHSADAVEADGRSWAPHLRPDAVVVFDDATDAEVAEGIARLTADGMLGTYRGWLGKMAVFSRVPLAAGNHLLVDRPIGRLR